MNSDSRLDTHACRLWRRRLPRGLSLMELLAVMLIISILLGFSGAVYWRSARSFKEQGAAAEVDVALRQAKNSALTANAPAYVEIDVKNNRIVPWVYKTVGLWHLEDRDSYGQSSGPYHRAVMRGATLFPEGKIGKCARLKDGAYVDAGADPDFDCEDGGFLEAYIRPTSYTFAGDHFIFSKRNAYFLKITTGGVLEGSAGKKPLKATSYRIVPGRWTKVAFAWDHQSTRIMIDDGVVAIGPGSIPPLSDDPLLIGHESSSMEGLVDEVRVMSASPGNALHLGKTMSIQHNLAPWSAVYFAPDGNLDMRYHAGPATITLVQDKRARSVNVSMLGLVSRSEVERADELAEGGQGARKRESGLTLYNGDDNHKPATGKPPEGSDKRKGEAK
ncbi:MAG TPA: LamG-like jellyroll fold domain-containing protein [Planctomycetota bacterium]|nr:LamG-like jellyroll fold domain-containing protein [Planctomycetota bacterium]